MENAVDALKMAAAILVFIIAITSSFSLFGVAKQTADSIITMRDRQAYLDSAEVKGGILYTSVSDIKGNSTDITEESSIEGVTTKGDRIVKLEDIISTIYRYPTEKYGVTIIEKNGNVLARYDSNTEQLMSNWNTIDTDKLITSGYISDLNTNTSTEYAKSPNFSIGKLKSLCDIKEKDPITGLDSNTNGAPWYGETEEIYKKIGCDFTGEEYTYLNFSYKRDEGLINKLKNKKIVEVTKEIDNSKYLKDGGINTNLLQEYTMPTIEIVYIILN